MAHLATAEFPQPGSPAPSSRPRHRSSRNP
jgi:hypothetical protein